MEQKIEPKGVDSMEKDVKYLENFMTSVTAPNFQVGNDGKIANSNFWLFPTTIIAQALPKYNLYEKIERSLTSGSIVSHRNVRFEIMKVEWSKYKELQSRQNERGEVYWDYFSPTAKVRRILDNSDKIYDAHTEKRRPRIKLLYWPPTPPETKVRELANLCLDYELPIMRRQATLPKHEEEYRERYVAADKEEDYDSYRDHERMIMKEIFRFAQTAEYPIDKFLSNLVDFLSYDIDFLEADGTRAEWWDSLLRNLLMQNFVHVDRSNFVNKRLQLPFTFLDKQDIQEFYDKKHRPQSLMSIFGKPLKNER